MYPEEKMSAYRYAFNHNGKNAPYTNQELEEEVKQAWAACDCKTCQTPCIHKDKLERFPRIVEGGADIVRDSESFQNL